ncbi:metallophosphoesterase [Hyphomicrobium sp.]|uniref:metallophosphoesterase n=1 Tax=Hyphomicrobium sp. TaxID=82 RepID=UPI003F72FC92
MITRRQLLKGLALSGVATMTFGGYGLAEPYRLGVTRYAVSPPDWPTGLALRIAIITDLHICEPWLGMDRLRQIVARTNALMPDMVFLLGDFVPGGRMARFGRVIPHAEWAEALAHLKAPLGVHAVLGNHDWWEDIEVQERRGGPIKARQALEAAGIPVYENDAVRLEKDGLPFWVAGLGDQWAFWPTVDPNTFDFRGDAYEGVDDLDGTLEKVTDDAPVLLMVHEPDIFPEVPKRVALTLAGHTHGGQVRVFGYAPVVPSRYGQRYLFGHIVEEERNLIVSAGLGCSSLPIRFGAPPEIVLVTVESGRTFA